jgi:hypothetical protein
LAFVTGEVIGAADFAHPRHGGFAEDTEFRHELVHRPVIGAGLAPVPPVEHRNREHAACPGRRDVDDFFGAADAGDAGAEVGVGVGELRAGQAELTQGLDGGAAVIDARRHAGGPAGGVEGAADGHVASTENQRVLAVDQVVHAEIEPLAGRDGGAVAVLLLVDEGAGLDGQVIAVNAAAAGVEQFGGADPGFAAIDEATIEEADGCVQLGGVAAEGGIGEVGDVGGGQVQRLPGLHRGVVNDVAGGDEAGIAGGTENARMVVVTCQPDGDVAAAEEAAVTTEAGRVDVEQATGDEGATGVEDGQRAAAGGSAGAVVGEAQGMAGGHQPAAVIHAARGEHGEVVVGTQGAVAVVQIGGLDAQRTAFDAEAAAVRRGGVDELAGGEACLARRADEAAGVVDAPGASIDGQIAKGLDLAAPVVHHGGGHDEGLFGADGGAVAVEQRAGGNGEIGGGADEAAAVVEDAAAQIDPTPPENARRAARGRVGKPLAAGIHKEFAAGLEGASGVVELATGKAQPFAGGKQAAAVVEGLAGAVGVNLAAGDAARSVDDAPGREAEGFGGFEAPAGVVEPAGLQVDAEAASNGADLAGAVVEAGGLQRKAATRHERAGEVVHVAAGMDAQGGTGGSLDMALAVEQLTDDEGGVAIADEAAEAVVEQLCGGDACRAAAALGDAAIPVVEGGGLDLELAGKQLATAVVGAGGVQAELAGCGQA